jgi:hypothetical protein
MRILILMMILVVATSVYGEKIACNSTQKLVETLYTQYEEAKEKGVCHIHGKKLQIKKGKLVFGELGPDRIPQEVELEKFPFSSEIIEGGCVVDEEELKKPAPDVSICSDCVKAREAYLEKTKK